jgi:fucose 4-O-acetylase-like acetyltransferase
MDRNEIVEITEHPLARIIGAIVIIGFAYLCFFQKDLVWIVNPLFSARRPFSALTYPATGGLQRLCYYPAVLLFIFSLISLAPRKESIMTVFGQNTLRVYCVHYFIISFLSYGHVFEKIPVLLPNVIWQMTVIGMAVLVTVILSLPIGTGKKNLKRSS